MLKKLLLASAALTALTVTQAHAQSLTDTTLDATGPDGVLSETTVDASVGGDGTALVDATVDTSVLDVDASLLEGGTSVVPVSALDGGVTALNSQLNLNDQSGTLDAVVTASQSASANALAIGNSYNLDIESVIPMVSDQISAGSQTAAATVTATDVVEFGTVSSAIGNTASVAATAGLPVAIVSRQENTGLQTSDLVGNLSMVSDAAVTSSAIGNTLSTSLVAPASIDMASDQINGGVQSATQVLSAVDGETLSSNTVAIGNTLAVSLAGLAGAGTGGAINTRQVNDGRQAATASVDVVRVTTAAISATAIGNSVSVVTRAAQ